MAFNSILWDSFGDTFCIMLHSILWCSILYYDVLLYSAPFYTMASHCMVIAFHSIASHSITPHCIIWLSIIYTTFDAMVFHCIMFHSILYRSILWHFILYQSIPLYITPSYTISFILWCSICHTDADGQCQRLCKVSLKLLHSSRSRQDPTNIHTYARIIITWLWLWLLLLLFFFGLHVLMKSKLRWFCPLLNYVKNNIWSFLTHYSSVFKFSTKFNI